MTFTQGNNAPGGNLAPNAPTINVGRLDDLLVSSQNNVRAINNLSAKLDALTTATQNVRSGLYALPYAFASLPAAASARGLIVLVTDSNTAVVGAAIAGGGANIVLGWSNGTAWKVLGS